MQKKILLFSNNSTCEYLPLPKNILYLRWNYATIYKNGSKKDVNRLL